MKVKDEVTAFQLGSSTVITLPKELGIKPGQKLQVKQERKKIVLQEKKMTETQIKRLVERLAGGSRLKDGLTPEEMNEELDRRYEDMLPR